MWRLWRGLRLGVKSLMLHKLRSGLTALGLIFGVAAVISMLAVGEGASRDAQLRIEQLGATNIILRSVKPSEEIQAAAGRPPLILRYGLTYDDYERIVETVPTVKRVLPVREIRKAAPQSRQRIRRPRSWARRTTTPSSTTSRSSRVAFSTRSDDKLYRNCAVLAHATAAGPFPLPRTRSATRSRSGTTRTLSSASPASGPTPPEPAAASAGQDYNRDVYIPLCYLPAPVRRADHRFPLRPVQRRGNGAHPAHDPGPVDRRSDPDGQLAEGGLRADPPQEGRADDRALRACWSRPGARPGSSASSWGRSPRSRSWSAASAS